MLMKFLNVNGVKHVKRINMFLHLTFGCSKSEAQQVRDSESWQQALFFSNSGGIFFQEI